MGVVETVKIVSKETKSGYMIINKSDLTTRDAIFKDNVDEVVEVVEVVEKEGVVIEETKTSLSKRAKKEDK
jgi:hypothetical protein